jgi:predicted acyltransferase
MVPGTRLASLDALRGFAIASMVLVNNPGDWGHLYAPLAHARWNGWTFTDVVFPMFLFCAGVAMTLSLGRRAQAGASRGKLFATTARRAGVVFLVGLALNFMPAFDPATVRIPGVLQRIALCILIAAPVGIWGGWRACIVAIAVLLLAYTVPMLFIAVQGADGITGAGRLEPGNDFGSWVDRTALGGHLWSQSRTWDPEGIVSTLPAAASLLFGVLAGHYIARDRPGEARAPGMAIAGVAFLVAGLALDALLFPINKNLWTPSYAVFMTGWSLLGFALFYAFLDEAAPRFRAKTRVVVLPLTIFGMNALFIFAFSGLVARFLVKEPLYAPIRGLPLAPESASLVFAILFEAVMFAVAWLMWKKRWFVTA